MQQIRTHGAGCCGVKHISNFGYNLRRVDHNGKREQARRIVELVNTYPRKLYEAIINHDQARAGWSKLLEYLGFRLVTKFQNPTGSVCYVYHYITRCHTAKTRVISKAPLNTKPSPPPQELRELVNNTDWSTFF